jgi:predicted amidohydrolase
MTYDLLTKGGTVVDPSQGLNAARDVALSDGRVAAVDIIRLDEGRFTLTDSYGVPWRRNRG